MAQIETTFVDLTTIVPAAYLNLLQEHLAGFLNLKVGISGTTIVEIVGASSDGVAAAYIDGEMRRVDTTINFTFVAEGADTYDVLVTGDSGDDLMAVEVVSGTPAATKFRKVAEVDWSGSAITALRGVRGRVEEHVHDGVLQPQVSHNDIATPETGDDHTQYVLPDATRDFTGTVGGFFPPSAAAHLATKQYADGVLLTVPTGSVFWWPSADAAPTGFLLADGAAVSRTVYAKLFGVLGEVYGVGDGSTTFNLPDTTGRMLMGKAAGSELGDTGGGITHTHTQAAHTHSQGSHTHSIDSHTHTGATTVSGGSHSHTQSSTGSGGSHSHTGTAHSHNSSYSIGNVPDAAIGSRHSGSGDSGLFPEQDLDNTSSSTSHSHGDGSYEDGGSHPVTGTSSSNSASHTHVPAANAIVHTHATGSVTGTSATGGTGSTGSSGTHTHTNPTTAAGGSHTHAAGGNLASAGATTDAGGTISTAADGGDVSSSATAPYLTVNAIIRFL